MGGGRGGGNGDSRWTERRRARLAGVSEGALGRSHCGGMMGQMRKAGGGKGGETDGGGRLFSFAVSLLPSNVLCHCNTTPLLRLFKSFHNNKNINNKNDHDNAKKYIYKPQPCLTTLSPQKGGGQALEFI